MRVLLSLILRYCALTEAADTTVTQPQNRHQVLLSSGWCYTAAVKTHCWNICVRKKYLRPKDFVIVFNDVIHPKCDRYQWVLKEWILIQVAVWKGKYFQKIKRDSNKKFQFSCISLWHIFNLFKKCLFKCLVFKYNLLTWIHFNEII